MTQIHEYRADIDGLRAIAVLAVLFFHAFPSSLQGGFTGVDVFFVISGYLISNLIFGEIDDGAFSFLRFYVRRIRRIFPALLVTLVGTYFLGWHILFADEFRLLGKHVFGGAAFVSNLIFAREFGYFDSVGEAKPLLHLWSLGVEEQFYIIWPTLVYISWRRRTSQLIAVVAILSFCISIFWIGSLASFYSPITRFWELMLGSGLAYFTFTNRGNFLSAWRNFNAAAGLALLFVAFTLIAPGKDFPGWFALIPTVGTALLIIAGPRAWLNRHVLSSLPLVSIGLISYPLYLVHWPLLSYAYIIKGEAPSVEVRIGLLIASGLLACLIYLFIEKPVRFGRDRGLKTLIASSAVVIVAFVGLATMSANGFPSRSVVQINKVIEDDLKTPVGSRTSDASCLQLLGIRPDSDETCLINGPNPEYLIIGDSTGMAFNSAAYTGASGLNTALVATHSHVWSPPDCMQSVPFEIWLDADMTCSRIMRHAFEIAERRSSITTVIISFTRLTPFFHDRVKIAAMQERFLRANKKVVYLLEVPWHNIEPSKCVHRVIKLLPPGSTVEKCKELRSELSAQQGTYRDYIASLKGIDPNILIYDPWPVLCDTEYCSLRDNDGLLYFIRGHVNVRGSVELIDAFKDWAHLNLGADNTKQSRAPGASAPDRVQ